MMMGILPATATVASACPMPAISFRYALGVCAGARHLVSDGACRQTAAAGFVARGRRQRRGRLRAERRSAGCGAPVSDCRTAPGTATIVARELADPGREGQAVSIMVLDRPWRTWSACLAARCWQPFVVARRFVRRRMGRRLLLLIARFVPAVRPSPAG
ncbi:MAG: hypothetical protein ACLSVD_09405 [Eggerthellaceae bacterium]